MSTALKQKARKRKAAAKALGIAIHQRYENLVNAQGEDEITRATVEMAQVMYDNVEFIVWALKSVGGLNPAPPSTLKPIPVTKPVPQPVNDLPVLPATLVGEPPANECTCSPMEEGIIGYKHMASCPQFEPENVT